MKFIKLLLCLIVYPIGISIGIYQSLSRWVSNFDMTEVRIAHCQWKKLIREVLRPGYAEWEHRKRIAHITNTPFDEKEP